MFELVRAVSAHDFLRAGKELTRGIFGQDGVADFVTSTCDHWHAMCAARESVSSTGEKLLAMFKAASGTCKKLLGSFVVITPHSMTTERAVSHFNGIRSPHRLRMLTTTVNKRLLIALNGVGTAHFDPRPAVAKFLTLKDRRRREASTSVYSERGFVAKFFRRDSSV